MKGNTPLHICAKENNRYMAIQLLSLGITHPELTCDETNKTQLQTTNKTQLKMRNNDGLTPFHQAIKNENHKIVQIMLISECYREQLIRSIANSACNSSHTASSKGK